VGELAPHDHAVQLLHQRVVHQMQVAPGAPLAGAIVDLQQMAGAVAYARQQAERVPPDEVDGTRMVQEVELAQHQGGPGPQQQEAEVEEVLA
jgi:hypothetical protein